MKINSMCIYPTTAYEGFTWQEFLYSDTALKYGLCNEPSRQDREAIHLLVVNLLHPLRLIYGQKIHITSGYRSPEVNQLVNGIPDSQHMKGEAVDLGIKEGPEYLLNLLKRSGLDFDQAIVYPDNYFLHLSYSRKGRNRHEIIYR